MDKKYTVNDDEFINYLEGDLPGKSRQEVERKLYLSGELPDLLRMMNTIYGELPNPADDLLGREITDSEDMKRVFREANELRAKKPADVSLEIYLKSLLREHLNLSEDEAEHIYSKLLEGIDLYHLNYDRVVNEEGGYGSMIESAMNDMDEDEQVKYLASVYVLLLTYNGKLKTDDPERIKKEVVELSSDFWGVDKAIKELQDRIQTELKNAEFLGSIIDEDTLRKLKKDFSIKYVLDTWRLDKDFAYYSAVAAYIAQMKGEIHLLDPSIENEEDVVPVALGLGIAAGVKQSELTQQVLSGEIEESKFEKYLKIALCVAAFALMVYLALHFAGPLIAAVVQSLAPGAAVGFWWKTYSIATLTMFFASLSLNVLLQGAFVSIIVWLIIEAVRERTPVIPESHVDIKKLADETVTSQEETKDEQIEENKANTRSRQNKLKH